MDAQLSQEIDRLKQDLNQIRSDLVRLLDALAGTGRETAESAKDEALERLRSAAAAISSAAREGRERSADIEKHVRNHQFLAALGTFGVGYLLGRTIGRR